LLMRIIKQTELPACRSYRFSDCGQADSM